ncbi:MAG: hypothetical protein IGS48_16760 [Oscillatoriales cyanobacterium C42_A2020_001]|nr:hypothetical protein [Leptolyngbyaceae cyanobacterium C42_A2020_001]
MSTLTLPHMNGSSTHKPADEWLQSSVQNFFLRLNWDDTPPDAEADGATDGIDEIPSLEISVSRFFASFNWDSNAIAAAVPVELPKSDSKGDFTLDDFSDLF